MLYLDKINVLMIVVLLDLPTLAKLAKSPIKEWNYQQTCSFMGEESEPIGERDIVKLILIIVFQTIILTALGIVFMEMFFVR